MNKSRYLKISSCACCYHFTKKNVMEPVDWDIVNKAYNGDFKGPIHIEITETGPKQEIIKLICGKTDKEISNSGVPIPEWCPLEDVKG